MKKKRLCKKEFEALLAARKAARDNEKKFYKSIMIPRWAE
jgi:hypothetical protein